MNLTQQSLPIANLGMFDLTLPLLKGGAGRPRILIINNLHGDELTGYYILEKLLPNLSDLAGQLTIVLSANPLGLIKRARFMPIDNADPNRGYPNPPQSRGLTGALRETLLKLASEHDVIIDLHTFMRPCLSAGLLLAQATAQNNDLAKRCLAAANLEIIIKIDAAENEKRLESSLGNYLIKQHNKLVIPLEYPPIRQIDNEATLVNFASGLKRVLEIINQDKKEFILPSLPIFKRQQIISSSTGLFIPSLKLRDKVSINQPIGFMIDPKNLISAPIISPYAGIITEIADRQLYIFGEKLATVGKHI